MLYRPISAHPSNGISIDATQDNVFSTIVQGASSVVTHHKASFYNADTLGWEFDTPKIELSKSLTAGQTLSFIVSKNAGLQNNRSYYWILRLYQQNPDMFITNTVVQEGSTSSSVIIREHYNVKEEMFLSINGERHQIIEIVIDTETHTSSLTLDEPFSFTPSANTNAKVYSNFIDSVQFGFSTNKIPTLKITNAPKFLDTKSFVFFMSYTQDEGVPMKWHQFVLTTDTGDIIEDTGRIFSADLSFKFDGFINGKNYIIYGVAETVNGVIISTPKYSFSASYPSPNIDLPPSVEVDYDEHAIKVEWVSDSFSEGVPSSNCSYHFIDNYPFDGAVSLSVDKGYVSYEDLSGRPLNITNKFGVLSDITITNKTSGDIISLESDDGEYYKLAVESGKIVVNKDGIKTQLTNLYKFDKSGQQESSIPEANTAYLCYRTEKCDKTLFCVKSIPFTKRYKVAMLHSGTKLSEVL